MQKLQPRQQVTEPKSEDLASSVKARTVRNDREDQMYMQYIRKQFTVGDFWSLTGSCFLSALFPEFEVLEGNQKVKEIRSQMSEKIMQNHHQHYLDYVIVIPGFSQLKITAQALLMEQHWAIAEDDSPESKQPAIQVRAADILKTTTFLMRPKYELAAQIIKRPIWIYEKKVAKFF
jgi:hypothetical protein